MKKEAQERTVNMSFRATKEIWRQLKYKAVEQERTLNLILEDAVREYLNK